MYTMLNSATKKGTPMTVREFLTERYAVLHNLKPRTVELFGHSVDRLRDFLGREPDLTDLDDLTVSRYLRWRAITPHRGRLAAAATVRKDMAHLVSLWNAAARKRLVEHFPDLPRNIVRVPHHAPSGYTVDEISRMVREARRRSGMIGPVPAPWLWTTLLMSAWYSGERIGSHLEVRWEQVDTTRRYITFLSENRKGLGRTITRQITPQLAEMLEAGRRADGDLVWPWNEHRCPNSIFQRIRYICRTAGVKPRGFHAIRKAAGSYVKKAGGDATEFLTHRDQKTTRDHYLDPRITGVESALDYLPPLDLG